MSPLRLPRLGRTGGRSSAVIVVAMLLAITVPAGTAAGVVHAAAPGSDHPGESTPDGRASVVWTSGSASAHDAGFVIQLFDPDDDRDEREGEEDDDEEGDDEEGDDEDERERDDDGGEKADEHGDEREDDDEPEREDEGDGDEEGDDEDGDPEGDDDTEGVGGLVEAVLTEVVGDPGDDQPGDGGEGPPDDRPERDGDAAGDDETNGPSAPAGDGSDGASSSQVEETTTTEPPEPARLRVADVSTNRSVVDEGEPVRITATIVNDGEEPGSLDVQLRLFGEAVDARTVTVPGEEAREVSFDRTILAPGTYEATVGNASTTVTVEASGTTTTPDVGPASQELPGFTALAALLGVLATALWVRRRTG